MKSTISPLMLLLVFAAPAAIAAEDIYRSTLPDGRVVYGESPFPGAKSVRKVTPAVSSGMSYVTPEEKARGAPPALANTRGGVTVIPPPPHVVPQPAQQGALHGGDRNTLPKSGY